MPTILKTKNSVTTTVVPTTLQQGELAVNITDKKMWVGNAATTPVQLFGAGADGSFVNLAYTGTLTGGTGIVNLGSGQFYKDANGNIGIGTVSTSGARLNVRGAGTTSATSSFEAATSGGATRFLVQDDGTTRFFGTSNSETMRITSAGDLGIGTTSPASKLNISGTSLAPSATTLSNATLNVQGTSTLRLLIGTDPSSPFGAWLQTTDGAGAGYPINLNPLGGNIGIGISNPAQKLHVASSSSTYIQVQNTGNSVNAFYGVDTGGGWMGTSTNHYAAFYTNNTERMRILSTGFVGIGLNDPATKLVVKGSHASGAGLLSLVADSGQRYTSLSFYNNTTARAFIFHDNTDALLDIYGTAGQGLRFTTNDNERMRIDSSGNVLVGTTGIPNGTSVYGFGLELNTNGRTVIRTATSSTAGSTLATFLNPNGTVGTIVTSGSSTAYNTSSDYRLKENISPMTGALSKVAQLKPCTYTWKTDGSNGEGFIAHELAEVCPDAVTGEKDGEQMQGIDTSFLVATLTAAIQELKAELDSVKAELQTLKGN